MNPKVDAELRAPTAPMANAKNVLFIIVDDLRVMQPSSGWSQPHLPNQERLMKESLTFDAAYAQQSVCGPSRASFLSGRRPDRTQRWNFDKLGYPGGFRRAPGATEWNTMPQYFANHGYYTAGAGKVYHDGDPKDFDPPSWTEPECKTSFPHSGQGKCPMPTRAIWDCPVNLTARAECSNDLDCFPDLTALENSLRFLHKAARQYEETGQPFFLAVGFVKPHLPFIFPSKYLDLVPAVHEIELPPNSRYPNGATSLEWVAEGIQKYVVKGPLNGSVPEEAARVFIRNYYAAAAFTDDLLGQLLHELHNLNLKSSTVVVMVADNGYGLGEHNHFEKYTNFETDTRVPLIVRAPWKPNAAGARTAALVELVDLYPSLAELAGIPVDPAKESIDGKSWAHLLDDPAAAHKDFALSQHPRCWVDGLEHNRKNLEHAGGVPFTDDEFRNMNRCAHDSPAKFGFMGYSLRTTRWRYTEWAVWNALLLIPDWTHVAAAELYDHLGDVPADSYTSFTKFENKNFASIYTRTAQDLSGKLHDLWHNLTHVALPK